MPSSSSSGEVMSSPVTEKHEPHFDHERLPRHPNRLEQNGLRTYGDDEDHDREPPVLPSLMRPIDG